MRAAPRFIPAVPLLLSVACAAASPAAPQPAPVIATADDQRAFAGVWRGEVDSPDGRFSGPVEFRFEPDEAVVLPARRPPARILWVRLSCGTLSGALEPYFDGPLHGEVFTTFDATLAGGMLRGTLHERVHMRWRDAATWSVQRVASSDDAGVPRARR